MTIIDILFMGDASPISTQEVKGTVCNLKVTLGF